jgi:membrane-associated phospholipid phosphatase
VAKACAELADFQGYRGPRVDGAVTPGCVFRGVTPGDLVGPYISQFLWKEIPYGAIRVVPHVRTATAGLDYLTTWDDWLAVQNGAGTVSRHAGTYRYIRSARDLAAYVQLDFSYQPFLTACLVLFGMEGTTDVRRPYKGAPFEPSIPYRTSQSQSGFSTLGVAHALDLVARVANLALQHAWFHKWVVHRWLRPEEFGGRIHRVRTGQSKYPIHSSVLGSAALDLVFQRRGSYLLPQAYPEGSPLHPSFPSGHAAIAGACATVLKAFFDESFPIEEPVVARPDGLTLMPYAGPALTVGGELNKLASNVAMGRAAAGIHWRSDNAGGMALGEQLAIELLRELKACWPENFPGFTLTRFDGTPVVV